MIKKIDLCKISYFREPHTHKKHKSDVELDLSNYSTKSNLKSQLMLIHQILLKKADLAILKSYVDELDTNN